MSEFSFTLNGLSYTSTLSGNAVQQYLTDHVKSNFATSLVNSRIQWGRWTQNQAMWAHKLVLDHQAKMAEESAKPVETFPIDISGIYFSNTADFLNRVTTLKRVKLKFRQAGGIEVVIKKTRNGFGYWITENNVLRGKINNDGRFEDRGMPVNVQALLDSLEESPADFCAAQGREMQQCVFCSLPLTDSRSLAKGYGPICAGHYGLSWGDEKHYTPTCEKAAQLV